MRALEVELQAQPQQDALQGHEHQDRIALQVPAPQVHGRDGHLPQHAALSLSHMDVSPSAAAGRSASCPWLTSCKLLPCMPPETRAPGPCMHKCRASSS